MYIFKILYSFIKNYKLTVFLYILFTILSFPLEAILVPQLYSHFFELLNSKTKLDIYIKYFILIIICLSVVTLSNSITTYVESYMIPEMNEYIINYILNKEEETTFCS